MHDCNVNSEDNISDFLYVPPFRVVPPVPSLKHKLTNGIQPKLLGSMWLILIMYLSWKIKSR